MAKDKTIQDVAVLVSLSISRYKTSVFDPEVTSAAIAKYNAIEGSGKFTRALMACNEISMINKIRGKAFNTMYEKTAPWEEEKGKRGARLCAAEILLDLQEDMRNLHREFMQYVNTAANKLPDIIEADKHIHGDMFNETDYPSSPEEFKEHYSFNFDIKTIEETEFKSDIRLKIGKTAAAAIERRKSEEIQRKTNSAVANIIEKLEEAVAHASEKLQDYDPENKNKNTFRDSLIGNIARIAGTVEGFGDIHGDKALQDKVREVKRKLADLRPEQLRKSDRARKKAAREAKVLAKDLEKHRGNYTKDAKKADKLDGVI